MRRLLLASAIVLTTSSPANAREFKVCADPNNLPFSNAKGEGFENQIVCIIAAELRAKISWVWHAQRRGNVRETLNAGLCDLIPGVASSLETLGTTRPYYRSTYVTVTRAGPLSGVRSFDDPRLGGLRIGVQLVGDDGANTPPAHALSKRGLAGNLRGYTIYGDYSGANPQAPIIEAVAQGELDLAFVWGPTAGYFSRQPERQLHLNPVEPQSDGPALPMVFDISMGIRRSDLQLKREIEGALRKRAGEIEAVLRKFGVPLIGPRSN